MWTLFGKQVRTTFLWSWMISGALVDYTNIGKIIGCILDNMYAPCVSMSNSIGSITSFFHTSMVVHPRFNDYLQIHNSIHGNILSSSSKKQQIWKVSLNNGILEVDYKITVNISMKYLYIAIRYLYITNQLISGMISRVIWNQIKTWLWRVITWPKQSKERWLTLTSWSWPKWMVLKVSG